jgi:hypothetical protein
MPIRVSMLQKWHALTTFEVLVELELVALLGRHEAAWLSQKGLFPSLKRLSIRVSGWDDTTKRAFFAALRPLERLQLKGWISPCVLSDVLTTHGPTLRSLRLPYRDLESDMFWQQQPTTLDGISYIRDHCPLLEEFRAAVSRDMSSRDEVTMYQALASMGSVTRMIFMIDCSAPIVFHRRRMPVYWASAGSTWKPG